MQLTEHEWVKHYNKYEAVLCCLNELESWDKDRVIRAFQTFGWEDSSMSGDEECFSHIETGIIVRFAGSVVAIDFGHGRLLDALPDLFDTVFALGWRKAEVYKSPDMMNALLYDMGKAIPAQIDFDIQPAKMVMDVSSFSEGANMIARSQAEMKRSGLIKQGGEASQLIMDAFSGINSDASIGVTGVGGDETGFENLSLPDDDIPKTQSPTIAASALPDQQAIPKTQSPTIAASALPDQQAMPKNIAAHSAQKAVSETYQQPPTMHFDQYRNAAASAHAQTQEEQVATQDSQRHSVAIPPDVSPTHQSLSVPPTMPNHFSNDDAVSDVTFDKMGEQGILLIKVENLNDELFAANNKIAALNEEIINNSKYAARQIQVNLDAIDEIRYLEEIASAQLIEVKRELIEAKDSMSLIENDSQTKINNLQADLEKSALVIDEQRKNKIEKEASFDLQISDLCLDLDSTREKLLFSESALEKVKIESDSNFTENETLKKVVGGLKLESAALLEKLESANLKLISSAAEAAEIKIDLEKKLASLKKISFESRYLIEIELNNLSKEYQSAKTTIASLQSDLASANKNTAEAKSVNNENLTAKNSEISTLQTELNLAIVKVKDSENINHETKLKLEAEIDRLQSELKKNDEELTAAEKLGLDAQSELNLIMDKLAKNNLPPEIYQVGVSAFCFDTPGSFLSNHQIQSFAAERGIQEVIHLHPGVIDGPVRWDVCDEVSLQYPWFAEKFTGAMLDRPSSFSTLLSSIFIDLLQSAEDGVQSAQFRDFLKTSISLSNLSDSSKIKSISETSKLLFSKHPVAGAEVLDDFVRRFDSLLLCPDGRAFVDIRAVGDMRASMFSVRDVMESSARRLFVVHVDGMDSPFVIAIAELLRWVVISYSAAKRHKISASDSDLVFSDKVPADLVNELSSLIVKLSAAGIKV